MRFTREFGIPLLVAVIVDLLVLALAAYFLFHFHFFSFAPKPIIVEQAGTQAVADQSVSVPAQAASPATAPSGTAPIIGDPYASQLAFQILSPKQIGSLAEIAKGGIAADGYFVVNGALYMGDPAGKAPVPMPGADIATFQYTHLEANGLSTGQFFAKDKNHVYLGSAAVPNVDAATFEVIHLALVDLAIAKDKDHVYVFDSFPSPTPRVLTGADPATAHVLNLHTNFNGTADFEYLLYDKNNMYHPYSTSDAFDSSHGFRIFRGGDGFDLVANEKSLYVGGYQLVPGADPNTFSPLGKTLFWKDKNYIYDSQGDKLSTLYPACVTTFESSQYVTCNGFVYYISSPTTEGSFHENKLKLDAGNFKVYLFSDTGAPEDATYYGYDGSLIYQGEQDLTKLAEGQSIIARIKGK